MAISTTDNGESMVETRPNIRVIIGRGAIVKKVLFSIIAVLLLAMGCSSKVRVEKTEPIDENNADYQTLLNSRFFSYGGVSESGEIPEEVKAFNRLLEENNAYSYFVDLEQNANNEGKLYALCGIYHTDFKLYQSLMEIYIQNEEPVNTMGGCMFSTEAVKEVIICDEDMAKAHGCTIVRLKDNKENFDKWMEENEVESFIPDFYGGGIPNLILKNNC